MEKKMDKLNLQSKTSFLIFLLAMPFMAAADQEKDPIQYCIERSSGVYFEGDKMVVVNRTPISITGDRKALDRAFTKTELRAKGILTRTLSEKHSSSLTSTDSSEDSTGTMQLMDANGKLTSSEVSSIQKDGLIILENNVSSANFVGLHKFEEAYSAESGEVCVAIGVSPEIVNQVNKFKSMMSNPDHAAMQKSNSKADLTLQSFHRRSIWK